MHADNGTASNSATTQLRALEAFGLELNMLDRRR
jgi:hypothetical protein